MDNADERRKVMNTLRVEVEDRSSSSTDNSGSDSEDDGARREAPWSHLQPAVAGGRGGVGSNINRRRLLSKQLSMKETTREAKWEKRRRQILRRSSLVSVVGAGEGNSRLAALEDERQAVRSPNSSRTRCLTDEDFDELRDSIELGFRFDEETGGGNLRDTLPALDFYFAVNRQLTSDPKLKTTAASPTSTLSAVSSSSTLHDSPSPRSPSAGSGSDADAWKIFSPGDHPQLVKTRLRHWAQVVACSVKHGCLEKL